MCWDCRFQCLVCVSVILRNGRAVQGERERTREPDGGRAGRRLSPSQVAGNETAYCHESGGTHVER